MAGTPDLGIGNLIQLLCNDVFSLFASIIRGVVYKILFQRKEGIWLAAVGDFPCLGKGHEAISCSTGSVAGRTEARDVPVRQEPVDDFIQSSIVVHFKLGRIFFLFFGITADTRTGSPADLGNPDFDDGSTGFGRFTGRYDDTCVGNRDTKDGNDFF